LINYPLNCDTPAKKRRFCRQHGKHLVNLQNLVSHWRFAPIGSTLEITTFEGADGKKHSNVAVTHTATVAERQAAWAKLPPKFRTALLADTGRTPAFLQNRPLPEPRFKAFMNRFHKPWRRAASGAENHWKAITGMDKVVDPLDNTQAIQRESERNDTEWPFDEDHYPDVN